jgi:hypothetical protein
VDKKAYSPAVKKCRPLEVEHKMAAALLYLPGDLVIKGFRTFRAVDVPDDMDHGKLTAVFKLIFHEHSPAIKNE